MAKASSRHFGTAGALPLSVPGARTIGEAFGEQHPARGRARRRRSPRPLRAARKPTMLSSHIGLAPRWHARLTIGLQPPDMATRIARRCACDRSSSTPVTPLPPLHIGDAAVHAAPECRRIGLGLLAAVDDRLDMHAMGLHVARRAIAGIIVGEDDDGLSRRRAHSGWRRCAWRRPASRPARRCRRRRWAVPRRPPPAPPSWQ